MKRVFALLLTFVLVFTSSYSGSVAYAAEDCSDNDSIIEILSEETEDQDCGEYSGESLYYEKTVIEEEQVEYDETITEEGYEPQTELSENKETIASGTCGYSVSWEIYRQNADYVLSIYGKGAMKDYSHKLNTTITDTPWESYKSQITKINIDKGVTQIGDSAFMGCENVYSIVIPDSVTTIGEYAFQQCSKVQTIEIPESVRTFERGVFRDCKGLESISIPGKVTTISKSLFSNCQKLVSVKIPNSVTKIEFAAFSYCESLETVNIPNSVISIPSGAFMCCESLSSIKIPSSVTSIGEAAFAECSNLTEIEIPESVTSIGQSTFGNCIKLETVTLPNIRKIEVGLFDGCESLKKLIIPSSVISIDSNAFRFCSRLSEIYIPISVKDIGIDAFRSCYNLKDVYYEGSELYFSLISIKDGNDSLKNAAIHYNSELSNPELPTCFMIDASAEKHGSIKPSGIVSVEEGSDQKFIITPEPGYKVNYILIDDETDNCKLIEEDIREYTFQDVKENHKIEVSFVSATNNITDYDKEKTDYRDSSDNYFTFSLSNTKGYIQETKIPFSIDLCDFFTPSTIPQNELIQMSMRVAMAAMDPDEYTRYENVYRSRASYIKSLMAKMDFQFSKEDIEYETPNGNTIGTAIASRQIKRGDEECTLVMVAVRGGGYLNEWAGNLNVINQNKSYTENHYGFDIAANTVKNRIEAHLNRHNITDMSNVKIWITGYSRAGAVSNLTAAKLDNGEIKGITKENVYAYCFECPKNTRSSEWNNDKYNNIVSIVNLVDLIPLVAPDNGKEWNYHRFGRTYFISDGRHCKDGYEDRFIKMRERYQELLGNEYGSEERLNDQLLGYYWGDCNKDIRYCLRKVTEHSTVSSPEKYGSIWQGKAYDLLIDKYKNEINTGDVILGEVGSVLLDVVLKIIDFDTYARFSATAGKYVDINHYPELTFSWVDTLSVDDYLDLSEINDTEAVFNCPVNITVRDRNNNIVGQIINNEPVDIENGIDTYVDEDGQKVVLLPSNGNYTIEATAYADGDVSVTTMNYSGECVSPSKLESYLQIDVKRNQTVTTKYNGGVPTVKNSEGNILTPDVVQAEDDIESYDVTVTSDGLGSVEGGGTYYAGEFCQVTAAPSEGSEFFGWYVNEERVSTEFTYRFPVLSKTNIKAVFSDESARSFSVEFSETASDSYEGLYYNESKNRYEITYTGSAIKPRVNVIGLKGALTEGVDYKLSYSNNVNYNAKGKPATVTVTGKGNYSGKTILKYYILPADLSIAKEKGLLTVPEEITVQSKKKLAPIITYGDYTLKTSDMELSNKAAVTQDTTVDISGKGNFTGKLENIPVKVLVAADLESKVIQVTLKAQTHIFNGGPQELTCSTSEAEGELTVTAGTSKTPLTQGTDYTVSYKANINAGTATVRVKGIGDYRGTVTKTFKILPDKTSEILVDLADSEDEIFYSAVGATPLIAVVVKRGGEESVLTEGKDYTLTYSKNKSVGTASYKVAFIGNYKGHAAVTNRTFKINVAPFAGVSVQVEDLIYTKPGKYLSAPYVSIDGALLSSKDYSVKYFDGDKELTSKSKLSLDDMTSSKEITVKVEGKGNYQSQVVTATYNVKKLNSAMVNLSKAKIVAEKKSAKGKDVAVGKAEYTGSKIKPKIRVLVKDGKDWTEVSSEYYTVKYINNVKRGKATILITGDGVHAAGSKKTTFTIGTKNMGLFKWLFG